MSNFFDIYTVWTFFQRFLKSPLYTCQWAFKELGNSAHHRRGTSNFSGIEKSKFQDGGGLEVVLLTLYAGVLDGFSKALDSSIGLLLLC